jgi:hypothetical protein
VFQERFLSFNASALLEDPPDHDTVLKQVMEDDHRTRGLGSQNGAGLLPGKNIQRTHNSDKHDHNST